jgi:hypothetical protein
MHETLKLIQSYHKYINLILVSNEFELIQNINMNRHDLR